MIALSVITFALATSPTVSSNTASYFASGTSETVGFGVKSSEAYPRLVAKFCNLRVTTDAEVDGETVRLPSGSQTIVSLFWSPDFAIFGDAMSEASRIEQFAHARQASLFLIIVPPPLKSLPSMSSLPAAIGARESLARRRIEQLRANPRVAIVNLDEPRGGDLLDGLHPSPKGHRKIAAAVNAELIRRGLCQRPYSDVQK